MHPSDINFWFCWRLIILYHVISGEDSIILSNVYLWFVYAGNYVFA